MQVVRSLDEVPPSADGRALAVGTFDGVHVGHRKVIGSALEWGHAKEVAVAVVTFDPHPLQVLRPDEPPRLLTSTAVKCDLIAGLGVDELIVIPFTEQLSRLDAESFARDVLAGTLAARHISVGANFHFGHGATGDPELLRGHQEFETVVVPLVEEGGEPVSSSRIRGLVERGDVAAAAGLLGHPYLLEGTVVEGDARGRTLGIPTANLLPPRDVIVPATGVYAGKVGDHAAAINVGVRPTFERDGELLVEAYLLDFDGDLYGDTLRIAFLERIRDEERFDSPEALVEQMQRDVERVRELAASGRARR
jgi:riboflavin kinase / FMN adenylyltransferase